MTFENKKYKTRIELAKYIWQLIGKGIPFEMSWNIMARYSSYKAGSRRCNLCFTEKFLIAQRPKHLLLNKRLELVTQCRHRNKFYLKNVK